MRGLNGGGGGLLCLASARCRSGASSPLLTGNDPDLLALSVRRDQPRLPPLVIRSIYDVEDVSIREAEALAGQAAVPRSIVIEQSSKNQKTSSVGLD